MEFLKNHEVDFETDLQKVKNSEKMNKEILNLVKPFLPKDYSQTDLDKEYLKVYNGILANREAYEYFNQTSYPYVGTENSITNLWYRSVNQRIVHFVDHTDTYLNELVPMTPRKYALNVEHARLLLNEKLGLSSDLPLSEVIHKAATVLLEACEHEANPNADPKSSPSSNPIIPLLNDSEQVVLILEGLGGLLEHTGQRYVNDEHKDDGLRGKLFQEVQSALEMFKMAAPSALKDSILDYLFKGLKHTLHARTERLMERSDAITQKMLYQQQVPSQKPGETFTEWLNTYKKLNELNSRLGSLAPLGGEVNYQALQQRIVERQTTMMRNAAVYVYRNKLDITSLIAHEDLEIFTEITKQVENLSTEEKEERAGASMRMISHRDEKALQEQLKSKNEMACKDLIKKQLIPITEDYLKHLLAEIVKFKPSLKRSKYHEKLPVFRGERALRIEYEKINEKYKINVDLLKKLKDAKKIPLPSERILEFTKLLRVNDKKLGNHRDKAWKRYAKACLIAIGLICTGIIPGIAALLTYSAVTGKAANFFAQSKGKEFSHQAMKKADMKGLKK